MIHECGGQGELINEQQGVKNITEALQVMVRILPCSRPHQICYVLIRRPLRLAIRIVCSELVLYASVLENDPPPAGVLSHITTLQPNCHRQIQYKGSDGS